MKAWYSTLATVVKQGGKSTLKLFDRVDFDRALGRFGEGEELELVLQTIDQKRTSRQNRFFHGPVCKAFAELGYTQVETKDMLALMFIPQELKLPDGSIVRVPGHTSALSVEEFGAFLEQILQFAAEQNIVIQDSDLWRLEQEKLADSARKRAVLSSARAVHKAESEARHD